MRRACFRHGLFLYLWLIAGLVAVAAAACGDDEPDRVPGTGGAGGQGGTGAGEQIGGFFTGPGGAGGGGDGGHGELTHVWSKVVGGTGQVVPRDAAIDGAGNIIVVGAFSGTVNLGGADLTGTNNLFIVKLDGAGNHVWSAGYGNSGEQGALGVAVDAGNNIILTGSFKQSFNLAGEVIQWIDDQFPDVYIAKLDPDGNHLYSTSFNGPPSPGMGTNDSGNSVATDTSDNIIVGGRFNTSINFGGGLINSSGGSGSQAMFVAKLSSAGNHLYSQAFGNGTGQETLVVAGGDAGAFALGGYSPGDINFGGGTMTHPGPSPRAVVARFDASGAHVFSALFVGGDSRTVGLAFGGNGDLFVAGNFKTSIEIGGTTLDAAGAVDDFFVARFDSAGNLAYASSFGDQARDAIADAAVDSQGFAYVAGTYDGELRVNSATTLVSAASVQDAFLIRVGPLGNGYAGISANADEAAQGVSVAVDRTDDSVVVVGSVSGTIDLGSGPLTGDADMFIAKFQP